MFFHFKQRLFQPIDIAPLVVFRILFGLLLFAETFGAILTGWVKLNFIDTSYNFAHIGVEWLQPLPGYGMYFYFGVMAIMGILVALGLFYRPAITVFSFMWFGVFLMQKTSYNNHYYLLVLLSFIMIIMPANRYFSLDAKRRPEITSEVTPYWTSFVFILQILIVYTYASIAKMHPDWLEGISVSNFLKQGNAIPPYIKNWPIVSSIDQLLDFIHSIPGIAIFISYAAILFDLLVVPGLLWKKTRRITFISALIFHLFNAVTFGIGIFPFLALALCIFCFDPEKVRRLFLPRKSPVIKTDNFVFLTRRHHIAFILFSIYFVWQTLLPLRHHLMTGDVLWNEAGHRLAWRMMLRSKSARTSIFIELDGNRKPINVSQFLSNKQKYRLGIHPDFIWQFAQHLEKHYQQEGYKDIKVFAKTSISVNGKEYKPFTDYSIDLTAVDWNYWNTQSWILPEPEDY